MGNYAAFGDIESEFKEIEFTPTTKLTDTEVDVFVDQAEAEIDGKLSLKYLVPITGTKSLALMKMVTVWMVVDRVRKVMEVKDPTNEEVAQGVRAPKGRMEALNILNEILETKLKLVDAVLATTHSGMKSFATSLENPHVFKRNVDDW